MWSSLLLALHLLGSITQKKVDEFSEEFFLFSKWLNSNQEFLSCPVCKNGISIKGLIPLYTKDDENNERPQVLKEFLIYFIFTIIDS